MNKKLKTNITPNICCYNNVQPGVTIDYSTGESKLT